MRVTTFLLLVFCVIGASYGGAVKDTAKAAAVAAKNAAIDAKNAALASAQQTIDSITEKVAEMIQEIEAQILKAIMAPVQRVQNLVNTIRSVVNGVPVCADQVESHVNETMTTMYNEIDVCKNTAFLQTHNLFTDCFNVIKNFPAHTNAYINRCNRCVKNTPASRLLSIHRFARAAACLTHATDDYQKLVRHDVVIANQTLTAAPGRVPGIISEASSCATKATNKAYTSLTKTLVVAKKCVGGASIFVV